MLEGRYQWLTIATRVEKKGSHLAGPQGLMNMLRTMVRTVEKLPVRERDWRRHG